MDQQKSLSNTKRKISLNNEEKFGKDVLLFGIEKAIINNYNKIPTFTLVKIAA